MKKKPAARGKPAIVSVGAFSARVYSTPVRGQERFTLAWADPTRGRVRETFGDFDSAKRRAEEVASNLQNGDTEAAGFTGSDRARLAAILTALRPTGLAAEVAANLFAEAHAILGGRSVVEAARDYAQRHRLNLPLVPVTEAVAAFIEDRTKAGASTRYVSDLRSRLVFGFAAANGVNLSDLSQEGVRRWLEGAPGGARSFNNNLGALRTLVRFCIDRRWLAKDSDLLDGLGKRKADGAAISLWTPSELAALLARCPRRAVPAMAICAIAGLRNAELLRLDWKEINPMEGFIEVKADKAKTAARRLAPCPANLVAWLAPFAQTEGPVWLLNEATLHGDFRLAAERAGLAWRDNALRHSFISYRLADIHDAPKVALEAGNSPAMIFRNYRELVRPADVKRWSSIMPGRPGNLVPMCGTDQADPAADAPHQRVGAA